MMPYKDDLTSARKLKTNDPYSEIVSIVGAKRLIYDNDFIAWVYTSNLGFDTVYCSYNGSDDRYEWETDWYEGGDVYLIAFADIDALEFDITQKWEGYPND